jgi:hypothetical protein
MTKKQPSIGILRPTWRVCVSNRSTHQFSLGGLLVSLAAFNGYALIFAHGLGYLSNNQVEHISFSWTELIIPICGYILLFTPLALFSLVPSLLEPPVGNLIIGATFTVLGLAHSLQSLSKYSS